MPKLIDMKILNMVKAVNAIERAIVHCGKEEWEECGEQLDRAAGVIRDIKSVLLDE